MKFAPLTRHQQHLHHVEMLKGELRELEKRAGISEAVERWTRSGTDGLDDLREIVFAVRDEGARRALIDKMRGMDAEGDRGQQAIVDAARADLAKAEGKGARVPWAVPSVIAVVGAGSGGRSRRSPGPSAVA